MFISLYSAASWNHQPYFLYFPCFLFFNTQVASSDILIFLQADKELLWCLDYNREDMLVYSA